MPDIYLRNKDAAARSKILSDANPITRKRKDQGLELNNDTSPNNPFNTISKEDYEAWNAYNSVIEKEHAANQAALANQANHDKKSNDISRNNPFNYTSYGYLTHHDVVGRNRLSQVQSSMAANQHSGMSTGLGVGSGNLDIPGVTSSRSPAPQQHKPASFNGQVLTPEQIQAQLYAQQQAMAAQANPQRQGQAGQFNNQHQNLNHGDPNVQGLIRNQTGNTQYRPTVGQQNGQVPPGQVQLGYSTFNPPKDKFPPNLQTYQLPQMESGFYTGNRNNPYGPSSNQNRATSKPVDQYSFIASQNYA